MIVKDSMVLIHLAKLSILEKSCEYFDEVIIPGLVHKEIIKGKNKGFPDVPLIIELVKNKKINIKKIKNKDLIKKANQFNIQRGEAEVVALYWQEKADMIASDDDNLRKKKNVLDLKVVGTPSIVLKLYKIGRIDNNKTKQCISELRNIGWFSNSVLDKILMEVKNG
jgi:predicted nucleic acid-binding protein